MGLGVSVIVPVFNWDKKLRHIKELFKLYPESQYFRKLIIRKLKVIIKKILPKKIIEMIKAIK